MAPASDTPPAAAEKYRQLLQLLGSHRRVLVAFSGGVDSTLLLAAAREALGEQALAVTCQTPSVPPDERQSALALGRELGVEVRVLQSREIDDPAYRRNDPDRCYVCKRHIFGGVTELARELDCDAVLEGSNADDAADYRPGRRATRELGVLTPLAEVGLTKAEIRALARERQLPVWDKPSLACLASRVPYGSTITAERLHRIGEAESWVRAQGIRQVRVRDHEQLARIEVEPAELERLFQLREPLARALKALGYRYVAMDLEGYRTGAMNEALQRDDESSEGG